MKRSGKVILFLVGLGTVILGIVLIRNIIVHFVININWYLDCIPDSTFFNNFDFSLLILEYVFFIMLGVSIVTTGLFLIMTAFAYTDHIKHRPAEVVGNIFLSVTGILMIIAGGGLLTGDIIRRIEAVVISSSRIWGSELLGMIWYWGLFFAVPIFLVVLGLVFVYAGIVFQRSLKTSFLKK